MQTLIINSGQKLSKAGIKEFKVKHNIEIPSVYEEFLLEHNGGYFENGDFIVDNNSFFEGANLDNFLGIGVYKTNCIDYVVKTFKNRIPPNYFPFARDPGGNLFCLSLNESENGFVYFWDHEFEADDGEMPSRENLYFLANSFEEFINYFK